MCNSPLRDLVNIKQSIELRTGRGGRYVGKQTPPDPMETVRRCKSLSQFAKDLENIRPCRVLKGVEKVGKRLIRSDGDGLTWRESIELAPRQFARDLVNIQQSRVPEEGRENVGVTNGPLKFLTARKILPLLAKFRRVLAPQIFALLASSHSKFFISARARKKNRSARHARECSQRPFVTLNVGKRSPSIYGQVSRPPPSIFQPLLLK